MIRAKSRLREFRMRRNLSQGQLAMQVGVDRSYITRIEQGRRTPAVGVLLRLAAFLGCAIDDLIGVQHSDTV